MAPTTKNQNSGTARRGAATASSAQLPDLAEALTGLPPRVRVHELARRAGLNSKDMIAALAAAGVEVGSASSSVDSEVAEQLLTGLLGAVAEKPAKTARTRTSAARAKGPERGSTEAEGSGSARPRGAGAGAKGSGSARSRAKISTAAGSETGDAGKAESGKSASGRRAAKVGAARAADAVTRSTADGGADASDIAAPAAAAKPTRRRRQPAASADGGSAAADGGADLFGAGVGVAAESAGSAEAAAAADGADSGDLAEEPHGHRRRRGGRGRRSGRGAHGDDAIASAADDATGAATAPLTGGDEATGASGAEAGADEAVEQTSGSGRRSRRRRGRGAAEDRVAVEVEQVATVPDDEPTGTGSAADENDEFVDLSDDDEQSGSRRRRRRRRRRSGSSGEGDHDANDDSSQESSRSDGARKHSSASGVQGVKGSTRLEAKRQRRRDSRETRRRPQILSEAEFLARRESVDRVMAVRQRGDLAQVALLEDGVLVEHFVSEHGNASMIGNIYLGRVQNVLPSMEAAFVDIGKGRNAVLYAGEVNWDIAGLEGKERRIETALSGGDTVLVQVSKDPIGHKGARLTTQISLPGRFLVFVPGGGATGISRKLPDNERKRLKKILDTIVPADAGVIIRTAAEGVGEEDLAADVERLKAQWQEISAAARKGTDAGHAPKQLYTEPDTLIKVVRDLFNSDISRLLIDGDRAWASLSEYVLAVAPELADRVSRYVGDRDVFDAFRIDEQITKALQRKVRLPSGGSLVIDRTEAMTVIDVNTGKFTGSGGNLEETVTRNNLEAAEEIVRQLRLRDIGGIIVVDFIDMVLESNRDLVLRRLTECLGRDRTRHQVAEVTSLGLVQMTRKRMGLGLVEAFSEPCSVCDGRGIVLHDTPSDGALDELDNEALNSRGRKGRKRGRHHEDESAKFESLVVERVAADAKPDPRGPKPPALFRPDIDTVGEPGGASAGALADGDVASDGVVAVAITDAAEAEAAEAPVVDPADAADAAAEPAEADVHPAVVTAGADAGAMVATAGADAAADLGLAVAPAGAAPRSGRAGSASDAKPARRRRAAGRPAGAPARAAESLDLVLPTFGAPADGQPGGGE